MKPKEGERSKTLEDINSLIDVLIENNSVDDLIIIVSGINEKLESDDFTTAMIAYFETYIEAPDSTWLGLDD